MTTVLQNEKAPATRGGLEGRTIDAEKCASIDKGKMNSACLRKFQAALQNNIERGGGLHAWTLATANLGVLAGLSPDEIVSQISASGKRFKRNEIRDAVSKALSDRDKGTLETIRKESHSRGIDNWGCYLRRLKENKSVLQNRFIESGRAFLNGNTDPFGAELWEISDPRLNGTDVSCYNGAECIRDTIVFLESLFAPDDLIFVGSGYETPDTQREHIKSRAEWTAFFSEKISEIENAEDEDEQKTKIAILANSHSFFVINPLTRSPNEKGSFRADDCVKSFRYVLLESDNLSLEDQIAQIFGIAPDALCSIVFSGGKSLHCLIRAGKMSSTKGEIESLEHWNKVKTHFFDEIGVFGYDVATKNPARLSRLPGILRLDKADFQRLCYLNRNNVKF